MTYVTRRWLVIGVYALLASLVVSYGFQPLGTWWLNLLSRVSNSNAGFELFVSLTVATLVILLIHQFAQTRLSHARWFSYPALPVAVVLALALASYWPAFHRWGTAIERPSNAVCMIAIAFYFAVWLSQTAILSIWTRLTDKLESKQFDGAAPLATKRIGEMSDDELLGWLKRESPIRTPSQDVFGFAEFAMRTLRRLDKGDNTIAVQGEYGAGKTSFIHLLELTANTNEFGLFV